LPSTPARRLRDAVEPIATVGWWSRAAAEGSTALGLDFFGGYVWGRAASMGADVEPSVVVSAFGMFDPALLTTVLAGARSAASREDVLAARERSAAAGLAGATDGADAEQLAWFGDRLLAALGQIDGAGRPLFSALRALPTPASLHGRAWRAAELLREHRGDGHVASCVAAGLSVPEMNVLTEVWLGYAVGEYSVTRGLAAGDVARAVAALVGRGWLDAEGAMTPAGRAARDEIEASTDRSQEALLAALGDDIDAVIAIADDLSARILGAQAAPADPRKRAAG
jgi:hypothetical protein